MATETLSETAGYSIEPAAAAHVRDFLPSLMLEVRHCR
jgi:hypothetical protein